MVLIDKKECSNELEALKYEREYIESMGATLNRHKPYRNQEDWDEKHRRQNEHRRQDRKSNPEKYKDIDKERYIRERDRRIEHSKTYYEEHKDHLNQKKADSYEKNKQHITCECGLLS